MRLLTGPASACTGYFWGFFFSGILANCQSGKVLTYKKSNLLIKCAFYCATIALLIKLQFISLCFRIIVFYYKIV